MIWMCGLISFWTMSTNHLSFIYSKAGSLSEASVYVSYETILNLNLSRESDSILKEI